MSDDDHDDDCESEYVLFAGAWTDTGSWTDCKCWDRMTQGIKRLEEKP